MTSAPSSFAIWTAAMPTPELAASTRTLSPGPVCAFVTSMWYAVSNTRGNDAASSKLIRSGFLISWVLLTLTSSAYPPSVP